MSRDDRPARPLWDKGEGAERDEAITRFMAGDDVVLDRELLPFDIRASRAHVAGLARAGLLSADEAAQLDAELARIGTEFAAGERELDERFEDGHSALEAWLTEALGELGRKVHTGRSRNDQVAVAMRLWVKERLERLARANSAWAEAALDRAEADPGLPLPGYTHLQRAMPSSSGLFLAGHAEAAIDNMELALQTADWIDASPLGTASGFGVNLPLDRDGVAADLGFARTVINPQYAQNARGKIELQALAALAAATRDLRRLAWDLSLFASDECGFVRLPDAATTGSSIMPNKRNPDLVELLRPVHGSVVGAMAELEHVLALPSSYHRDLQNTKPPVMRAFRHGLAGLDLVPGLLCHFDWVPDRMRAAIDPALHATDLANERVRDGMPFRDAYREVAGRLYELGDRQPEESLAARTSPGGCADLGLDSLRARLRLIMGNG